MSDTLYKQVNEIFTKYGEAVRRAYVSEQAGRLHREQRRKFNRQKRHEATLEVIELVQESVLGLEKSKP